jgi:uncharacterized protein
VHESAFIAPGAEIGSQTPVLARIQAAETAQRIACTLKHAITVRTNLDLRPTPSLALIHMLRAHVGHLDSATPPPPPPPPAQFPMASQASVDLAAAASKGDLPAMERALAAGADPDAYDGANTTSPLQRAAMQGHMAALAALLAAGARVDATDATRGTALSEAANGGRAAAVRFLLDAGADVHHASMSGRTSLHWACSRAPAETSEALLDAGARLDVRSKAGRLPIDEVSVPAANSLVQLACVCSPMAAPKRRRSSERCTSRRSSPCWNPERPGPAAGRWLPRATTVCGRGTSDAGTL